MKFSIEWLKYFLETDASVQEIADKLNALLGLVQAAVGFSGATHKVRL